MPWQLPSLEPEPMPGLRERIIVRTRIGADRRAAVRSANPIFNGKLFDPLWREFKPLKREAEVSSGLSSSQRWRPRLTSPFCVL